MVLTPYNIFILRGFSAKNAIARMAEIIVPIISTYLLNGASGSHILEIALKAPDKHIIHVLVLFTAFLISSFVFRLFIFLGELFRY